MRTATFVARLGRHGSGDAMIVVTPRPATRIQERQDDRLQRGLHRLHHRGHCRALHRLHRALPEELQLQKKDRLRRWLHSCRTIWPSSERLATLSPSASWTSPTTSASLWFMSQVAIPTFMLQLHDLWRPLQHRLPDPDRRDLHRLQRHRQGLRFVQKPHTDQWHQVEWKHVRSLWRTSRSMSTR